MGRSQRFLPTSDEDLFFAFGFAMAQDRLFQLDYLRRKGHGRSVRNPGQGTESSLDTIARTVGLNRIAQLDPNGIRRRPKRKTLLHRFSEGVNALIDQSNDNLPVEFALA